MAVIPSPTTPTDSAHTEVVADLSLALRHPGVPVDREMLEAYVNAAAPNSIRALRQDIEAFDLWCRRVGLATFPATPKQVADWLKHRAGEGAAPASLVRYKASLAKAHRLLKLDDPTKHELCRLAIAAHRRAVGSRQKQARPLRFRGAVKDPVQDTPRGIHVRAILDACDDTPTGLRNRALLSTAYDTGLRASELIAVDVADLLEALDPDARLLAIDRHKGDQEGAGATAYLSPRSVKAINAWLKAAEIKDGPIFRRVIVRRYAARPARKAMKPSQLSGRALWDPRKFVGQDAVAARVEHHVGEKALHPGSITPMFRKMIAAAIDAGAFGDLDKEQAQELVNGFSAHSTRVGLNQDLFAVGETLAGIMDALRWKSPKMPLAYNRNLAAEAGAAGRLLSKLD
ncbi:integrase [Erythrobacter sp. KY5]|uniref:tyrosine-type recombinase/integrase n=1 Tax=Erythrobacter sp. KY5 TaxID=2011159 RepID=UPI000DBF007C|nr:tyrosine-type recombinase/integrase [Erythrobacter sp. KY5]AWW72842.1 integrase [Erythrobacter sp. KY5]